MGGLDDVSSLTDRELLALSSLCVEELRERGVVRTRNAPLGDYAEWLAAKAFSGELAPNSERSFDLTTGAGVQIQVKARRVSNPPNPGQLQTSPFRSWGFDQALLVLVDEHSYEVRRASLIPRAVVEELSRYVAHVNGSNAYMTEDLMGHAEAVDVTGLLRAAAGDSPLPEPTESRRSPRRAAPLRAEPVRSVSAPPAQTPSQRPSDEASSVAEPRTARSMTSATGECVVEPPTRPPSRTRAGRSGSSDSAGPRACYPPKLPSGPSIRRWLGRWNSPQGRSRTTGLTRGTSSSSSRPLGRSPAGLVSNSRLERMGPRRDRRRRPVT